MNKLFTKIATAFVGIAMAIGVGVAVGSHSDVRRADAATSEGSVTASNGALKGWSGTVGSKYSDGSVKFGTQGNNLAKTDIFSGTVSSNMTQLVVTFEYKINGSGTMTNNAMSVTPYVNGSYGTATAVSGFKSTSKTTKSITVSSGLANCTGFKITYSTKQNGNLALYSLSWTATYSSATYSYSVTYNGNDNTGGTVPSQQTGTASSVTLSNTELTKTGYKHIGWSTEDHKGNTSPDYSLGQKVDLTAAWTVTLYAHWKQVYSVTYLGNGNTGGDVPTDSNSPYDKDSTVTVLGNTGSLVKTGYEFTGWKINNEGTLYKNGDTFDISSNTVLYAQWEKTVAYEWVKTDLADITSSDKFVIVGNNGSNYAMSNGNGTGSAPSAVSVTIVNDKITSSVGANIQWNLSVSNSAYTFYPAGSDSTWLYCTNTNNGVRVGTTDSKTFTVHSSGYLQNTGTSRYVGIYNSSDWRCYTSNGGNIANQTFSFYKGVAASTDPEITEVTMTGSPASSAVIGGGNSWEMSASATAINDEELPHKLTRKIDWTVSPSGAVTFSKNQSDSDEVITVIAVNTANSNVVITASSADEDFTSVHADSNTFEIVKSYDVSSVTLNATTAGGPDYDADGEESFQVSFLTSVNYSGDVGGGKVNISVDPSEGVSGYGNNKDSGSFDLTFTKNGTFTVTSTAVDNANKSNSVTISVSNILKNGYEKVTSASSFRSGLKVIIGCIGKEAIMTTGMSNSLIAKQSYTVTDGFIPSGDVESSFAVFDVDVVDGYWEFTTTIDSNKRWLACDGDANRADYNESSSDATKWIVNFDGEGNFIINPKNYTSRQLMSNNNSGNFGCYTGTQIKIQVYAKVDNSPYFTINTTSVYLGNRGTQILTLTAHNKASATVSWSVTGDSVVKISPDSGLSTTLTAEDSGEGVATVTATFSNGNGTFEPISVRVEVMELDSYVNVGVTTFTKVDSVPSGGWTGTYLLVDESAHYIFDGSASPLSASSEKDIGEVGTSIQATSEMIKSSFNIKASTNGYTIRSNSNYFFGNPSGENKNINTSLGEGYEVSIDSSGTITALDENGKSTNTTLRRIPADHIWRFYNTTSGNAISLYKADGDIRAITDTITDWYDNAKANGYLVCNNDTSKSLIDWTNLSSGSFYTALTNTDKDTLKRMSAKSAEDNGNYLEDFISDYDYLVQHKGYTDFLGRFTVGGAMHGASRVVPNPFINNVVKTTNTSIIVIVTVGIAAIAIGGYFLLRKKKED